MNKIQLLPLKNQTSFDFVSKNSIRFTSAFFTIFVRLMNEEFDRYTSKPLKTNRMPIFYGFKISKKIGKSHERNLIKRRLKNIYLGFFQGYYAKVAIVFIPRRHFKDLDFNQLDLEMNKALKWSTRKLRNENL